MGVKECFSGHAQSPPGFIIAFSWRPDSREPLCLEFWTFKKCRLSNFRIQDALLCEEIFRRKTSQSSCVIGRFFLFTDPYIYELIRASQPPYEMGKAGFWVYFICEDTGIKRTLGFKDLDQTTLWVGNKGYFTQSASRNQEQTHPPLRF